MNKPIRTYWKREIKKVMPLLAIPLLFSAFVIAQLYQQLHEYHVQGLLSFAFPEEFGGYLDWGERFIAVYSEWDGFHIIVMMIFLSALTLRVFYQENRAGISDFLRTLPIRERDKMSIKLINGESAILVYCLIQGLSLTAAAAVWQPGITEVNRFAFAGTQMTNTCLYIWKIMLLSFLVMSVIYFVFFAAQCCIHNTVLGFIVGTGVLLTPFYTTLVGRGIQVVLDKFSYITGVFWTLFPNIYIGTQEGEYSSLLSYAEASWAWSFYTEKLMFLLIFAVAALAVIVLAVAKKWHIRESNNRLINARGVTEFILAGVAVCGGFGLAMLMDGSNNMRDSYLLVRYVVLALFASAILFLAFHVFLWVVERQSRQEQE